MKAAARLLLPALCVVLPFASAAQTRVIDSFDTVAGWTAQPSDGVSLKIRSDSGQRGRGMRLDFDFHGGGGYAVARKMVDVELPQNYELTFWIHGEAPVENLEVKLVDQSGENVWWSNQRDYVFPAQWKQVTLKKRHITFAWGPLGGGELRRVAAIEVAITAGRGGSGTVWIDELALTPLEPDRPYDLVPKLSASTSTAGSGAARAMDGDSATAWRSASSGGRQWLTVDFRKRREFGGLVIDWAPDDFALDYDVQMSADGMRWSTAYTVRGGNGGRDYIALPETDTRWLRLALLRSAGGRGYAIREITVQPLEWAATPNDLFRAIARDATRGSYPRYFSDEQSYWTIVGANGDAQEGLLSEDGMLETGARSFSVEPFLYANGRLITWADVERTQSLERGDLPIPSVEWKADSLALTVTAFAAGEAGASSLVARYRVRNVGARPTTATLFLALRPFQVNPSWQFLGVQGGVAPIQSITWDGTTVRVNGNRMVLPITAPAAFGAATFDEGAIAEFMRVARPPARHSVRDDRGYASGVLAYPLELPAGGTREIALEIPLGTLDSAGSAPTLGLRDSAEVARRLDATVRAWESLVDRVTIELPPHAMHLVRTLRSTLAYILINRDGPAIQPGSRSYARSWIRDGSLTSAALLRLGHADEARAFAEWFAPYQYPNGKVPCCVDARGADPVPEHDSHGQLIYLIMEYYRYTHDRAFLERMWPHVARAVTYIDSLRRERMTPEYQAPAKRAYYGLVPQSISHEGYSAKPMHSYWDDFFVLRGLKDAADAAAVLGKSVEASRYAAIRDEFRRDLLASIRLAMDEHHIDYIPGSVELGDFDATSTTVGIAPAGEIAALPDSALRRTFERYWREVRRRPDSTAWDAYTPYELRTVGTFVRLGWKARAHELLAMFFADQRPRAWNQWAEVVWRDPRAPKFIGDMPHTWVGSDYIRSVMDMFAYEREADSALVVGAGIPAEWVTSAPGVVVKRMPTYHGLLDFTMRAEGDSVRITLAGLGASPPGGIVVRSPLDRPIREASVDGRPMRSPSAEEVVVRHLPAEVILRY